MLFLLGNCGHTGRVRQICLVVVLQLVTGPVGTHLLGRAVYRRLRPPLTGVDELARDEAGHES